MLQYNIQRHVSTHTNTLVPFQSNAQPEVKTGCHSKIVKETCSGVMHYYPPKEHCAVMDQNGDDEVCVIDDRNLISSPLQEILIETTLIQCLK